MSSQKTVLVIGGGISGLACAWRLRQLQLPVLLLEGSARFGGLIDTVETNGFRFDVGPQSFLADASLLSLLQELGLCDQLCKAPPRAPRYILHGGRLLLAPLGPGSLWRTPLFGRPTKLRLFCEPFQRTRPPQGDESIAAFVRRKFGEDLLENLVAPFVSGVYAGDPEKLSLASAFPSLRRFEEQHGSIIRGALKSRRERNGPRAPLCNFPGGVTTLTAALGAQLSDSARRGAEIMSIRPRSANSADGFEVACSQDGALASLDVVAVVLAAPTSSAARLLSEIDPHFGEALARIEYVGVAQVSAGYPLSQVAPPGIRLREGKLAGFGFLVPRGEGLRILGTVWNSFLFPGRAPEGMASFTSFLGGATDPALCELSAEEIARIARYELATVMSITAPPVVEHVSVWKHALPQYNLGHSRIVAALQELCGAHPGIFLAGNYLNGPSLSACVEQANQVAGEVSRFCASTL